MRHLLLDRELFISCWSIGDKINKSNVYQNLKSYRLKNRINKNGQEKSLHENLIKEKRDLRLIYFDRKSD